MVILCDSREQDVLELVHPYISEVRRECLPVGDYMVKFTDGYVPPITFERKSHTDLFSTLGVGFKRFRREITRSQDLKLTMILLVCCSLTRVLGGSKYSALDPQALMRRVMTLWIKHGVIPVFCQNSTEASRFLIETFYAAGKEHIHKVKEIKYANPQGTVRPSHSTQQAAVPVLSSPITDGRREAAEIQSASTSFGDSIETL